MKAALLIAALTFAAPAPPGDRLSMTYWPGGEGTGPPIRWTLRCNPPGGSLPRFATACARLEEMTRPFAVPPKDQICTDLYGGPQEAIVAGTWQGRRIWVHLARRNGCEIARFSRLRFLVPAFSGSGGPA